MTQTDELKAIIAEEAADWARGFIAARVQYLSASKISRTGALESSLGYSIERQARQEAVEILLAFEEHGRFIDMKPTAQDKWGREAVARVQDWARRVGLEKFERGYRRKYGKVPALDSQFLNKIAWGILIKRTSGKYRRRRWWNKPKTAGISDLLNLVASRLPDKVADQVKQTLNPN